MSYLNQFVCCGRLASEPQLETEKTERAKFVVALNKPGVGRPYYIECIIWGPKANLIKQAARKGDEILLTGELETNSYRDARQSWHKSTVLRVEKYSILGGKLGTVQQLKPPL